MNTRDRSQAEPFSEALLFLSRLAALGLFGIAASPAMAQQTSELWGKEGEKWSPESRLPDFSHAGYRRGEEPYRIPEETISVKDFGATGDGTTDDTEAFKKAIAAGPDKLVLIPKGRYVLTDILEIAQPRIVLRGEGPEATVLLFTRPLQEIKPTSARTGGFGSEGKETTTYSWSGGLISIKGDTPYPWKGRQIPVTAEASRGTLKLTVGEHGYKEGDEVLLSMKDTPTQSLLAYLHRGQAVDLNPKLAKTVRQVFRVTAVAANEITLDRGLRFDVKTDWNPGLNLFAPEVTDVGVEELGFEFPAKTYTGHWEEVGFNPVEFSRNVAHCWIRNIWVRNADSGPFVSGWFCSVDGITFGADRKRCMEGGISGHHGVSLHGHDGLCTNFVIDTKFFHDVTVSGDATGNVFSRGQAEDFNMDHHKYAPYENLFTDIDAGEGTRIFLSGGGAGAGNHSAAGATFWNIRSKQETAWPEHFKLDALNLVALEMRRRDASTQPNGRWIEPIAPGDIAPANLHLAMRQRRLGGSAPVPAEAPAAAAAIAHSWKSVEGRVIEAQFGGLQGNQITLIREGKSFEIPLERLSPESQALARQLAAGR